MGVNQRHDTAHAMGDPDMVCLFDSRGPDSKAETLTRVCRIHRSTHRKNRKDIKTWFDALDLDDFVSFGGKP